MPCLALPAVLDCLLLSPPVNMRLAAPRYWSATSSINCLQPLLKSASWRPSFNNLLKPPMHPHVPMQHPRAADIFERELAPFLSQSALRFWRPRLRYFAMNDGLYYHGGMVSTEPTRWERAT